MDTERAKFAPPPGNQGLLSNNGIKITTSPEIFHKISEKHGIPWTEVRYNRAYAVGSPGGYSKRV